ncbi:MAG: ABC transporter permease [Bacteroidota bacterium]|nr:ABC transporter permease [Bacteroidota bacterium]
MFKNYFKTAFRNLLKHKSNSFINITGLIVGFAAFLLIFLVIQYEQSFDNFHANKDHIYRVVRIGKNPVNREYRTGVPYPVTPTLRNDFPQLKNAAAISGAGNVQIDITSTDGSVVKKFKEPNVFLAEPQFFQMFNFSLAAGDITNAINDPNTALLTKNVAEKFFGDWKSAIGKTLNMLGLTIKVTGILNNPPSNTDFPLGVVVSYATLTVNTNMNNWSNIDDDNYCFVELDNNYPRAKFNTLLAQFVDEYIKPVNPNYDLSLQPLNEIHYDERYGNFNGRTFGKDLILALSLIALFLLVIACVNFINLTTAQAISRAREVGIRKVLGSIRKQLIIQFLGETGITVLVALICSVIVVFVCLSFVNDLLDINLSASLLYNAKFLIITLCAFLVVTFLSGSYPALVLSGFKVVNVLKSRINASNKTGISLRRGLVVFQFVIAQALIIGTLIVASQMNYFRNADMGFDKTAIINAGFPGDSLSRTKVDFLKNELFKIPGIENVSFSTFTPSTTNGGWATDLRLPSNQTNNPDMIISVKPADTSFFRLYNLPLVAGRIYYPSDTMREFVVNETVVKKLDIQDPKDAIGKLVNINGNTFPIVGVVKDFHISSLRDPIGPVVLTTMKRAYHLANIKINLSQAKHAIASMQKVWNTYFPDYVFEYSFLDKTIADFYKQENQLAVLYKIFSAIAIFISCLGLYGLISFMALQRRKEISIRKVLGAPVQNIVIMLVREFTILISIAFLIAAPIAWYFMHEWLQQYTFRITIGLWFFATTIIGSLIIAWLTVGFTAIKAALTNPVKSLRTE